MTGADLARISNDLGSLAPPASSGTYDSAADAYPAGYEIETWNPP